MITIYTAVETTNPTIRNATKTTHTKHLIVKHSSTKDDDTSIMPTPTLETLSIIDIRLLHSTTVANDAILRFMILKQPSIVRYGMLNPPTSTHNWSWEHSSTAVQYALIGVYDKLHNSPKLPCLLPTFNCIACVVLSGFLMLSDSLTLVKIDDQYFDEWFD